MRLSAPTQAVFIITLILGLLGLLGGLGVIAPVAGHAFWLVTIAWVVLTLACLVKGM